MEIFYNLIKAVFAALMSAIVTVTGFFSGLTGKGADKPEIPAMAPGTIAAEDAGESDYTSPVLMNEDDPVINYEGEQSAVAENFSLSFDSFSRDLPAGYSTAENKIYDGTMDAANILKPSLSNGEIQLISLYHGSTKPYSPLEIHHLPAPYTVLL